MSPISHSQGSSEKRRRRNYIWDMYEKEENSHGEIKWKCSECQVRLSNYPTSVSRRWEFRSQISEEIANSNSRDSRVQSTAFIDVLSIPCMSVNLMLHPLVRELFYEMNPKIEFPSSFNALRNMLTNRLDRVKQALKVYFNKTAHRFSLTCDVWSDKGSNNAYLGVALHYCNEFAVLKRVTVTLV
uniref:Transposase n=1 Tax=Ditylenchus dipsaci TaxID=166011 RepID=A0A915D363_9BILA